MSACRGNDFAMIALRIRSDLESSVEPTAELRPNAGRILSPVDRYGVHFPPIYDKPAFNLYPEPRARVVVSPHNVSLIRAGVTGPEIRKRVGFGKVPIGVIAKKLGEDFPLSSFGYLYVPRLPMPISILSVETEQVKESRRFALLFVNVHQASMRHGIALILEGDKGLGFWSLNCKNRYEGTNYEQA